MSDTPTLAQLIEHIRRLAPDEAVLDGLCDLAYTATARRKGVYADNELKAFDWLKRVAGWTEDPARNYQEAQDYREGVWRWQIVLDGEAPPLTDERLATKSADFREAYCESRNEEPLPTGGEDR